MLLIPSKVCTQTHPKKRCGINLYGFQIYFDLGCSKNRSPSATLPPFLFGLNGSQFHPSQQTSQTCWAIWGSCFSTNNSSWSEKSRSFKMSELKPFQLFQKEHACGKCKIASQLKQQNIENSCAMGNPDKNARSKNKYILPLRAPTNIFPEYLLTI